MHVRPLEERDWPPGDEILRDVYVGESYVEPAHRDRVRIAAMASAGTWLGAFLRHEVLAGLVLLARFGSTAAVVAEPDGTEVRLLAVAPQARGSGVGATLMHEAERRARAEGAGAMTLSSQATMTAAHRLYTRLGYERTPERDYTAGAREFIVFRKSLLDD